MENSVKPFHQNVFGGVALVEQRSGKYNSVIHPVEEKRRGQ